MLFSSITPGILATASLSASHLIQPSATPFKLIQPRAHKQPLISDDMLKAYNRNGVVALDLKKLPKDALSQLNAVAIDFGKNMYDRTLRVSHSPDRHSLLVARTHTKTVR
jgi:hypothetical protein